MDRSCQANQQLSDPGGFHVSHVSGCILLAQVLQLSTQYIILIKNDIMYNMGPQRTKISYLPSMQG